MVEPSMSLNNMVIVPVGSAPTPRLSTYCRSGEVYVTPSPNKSQRPHPTSAVNPVVADGVAAGLREHAEPMRAGADGYEVQDSAGSRADN
jgi:hypothetical protein